VTLADDDAPERPVAYRRALPWAVGTALMLAAVTLVASVSTRQKRATVQRDSIAASTGIVAPAAVPTIAPAVPHPSPVAPSAPRVGTPTPPPTPQAGALGRARATASVSDLGESISDSIRRIVGSMPMSQLMHVDSLFARIGPAIEQARRADATRGTRLPLRHYWLAPNGDSISAQPLPRDAPMEARAVAAEREIRGHIARMKERFATGDVRSARQELMTASGELSILRNFDPDPDHAAMLQRELGDGVRDVLVMCYRMRADSTLAPATHCESFLAVPGRIRELREPR
jgi:hypothetical protein